VKVDVYQRPDSLWGWRLIAANGRIVATDGGQGYSDEAGARRGFASVVRLIGRWLEEVES
jgi:uncharacterized protein YegP (UPF0339 family)